MCGRFAQTHTGEAVAAAFQLAAIPDLQPRYNIAPSQMVAVVTASRHTGERELHDKKWGLIPGWSQDPKIGYKLINARSETVADKPAFRSAFQKRRCLVVADGFYEWQAVTGGGQKQPYLIHLKTRSLFGFAGLWERWRSPETGEAVFSCTILTTQANQTMEPVHHRMPVILPSTAYDAWLDPSYYNRGELAALLQPCDSDWLDILAVSPAVNNPRNNTPLVQSAISTDNHGNTDAP
ncbi:MAG: SOS response-associated peptidase [Leptolyngbyaceae cyanobacterium]